MRFAFGLALALFSISVGGANAQTAKGTAPQTHQSSSVCDIFVFVEPKDGKTLRAAVADDLLKSGCKAGDVVRIVSDGGLAYSILPEAICDYKFQIIIRPEPRLRTTSCIYTGSMREWRN